MNKIYSVVKNRAGNMTVASEIAKGAKKGRVVGAIASLSFMLLSNASYANYKAGTSNVYDPIGAGIGGDPAQYVIVGDKNELHAMRHFTNDIAKATHIILIERRIHLI